MTKQTYWIADPNGGAKALVEGAAERDRWKTVHGWEETSEPVSGDTVWMHNASIDGKATLPFDVIGEGSYWQGVGFEPGAPEEPADSTKDPVLRDQTPATVKPEPAAKPVDESAKTAANGGTKKES